MQIGIIGTSIWQQNMPLLEKLTINRDQKIETLEKLKEILELDELIYLSTCNRVEFIFSTSKDTPISHLLHRLIDFFFKGNRDISFFPNDFFQFSDKEAITHLFRMTSSLESLVVGETQITGQFKDAYQDAMDTGFCGPVLKNLADEALAVSKVVKRKTNISEGCLSMASLVANELTTSLKKEDSPTIALIGSGTMSVKMAKYVKDLLNAKIIFVNRTLVKAEALAEQHGGSSMSLENFITSPPEFDAIVSATAATDPIFDTSFLTKLIELNKPVICVDLAIPRDFAFEYNGIENITLVDIPYLKSKVQLNLRQKFVEASKADDIVRDTVLKFISNRIEVSLKPIFKDSYQESMEFAKKAFDELLKHRMQSLPQEEKDAVFELITKVIGHSSYQPVQMLSSRFLKMRSSLDLGGIGQLRKEAI